MVGLDPAQVEPLHESIAGCSGVLRASDDRHHLVDDVKGPEQALHDVEALFGPGEPVGGPSHHHIQTVVDVVAAQVVEAKGPRFPVD